MRKFLYVIMLTFVVLVMACAPKQTPSPTASTPKPSSPAPITPASNIPPLTSQDAAWAKVVLDAQKEGRLLIYSFAFAGDVGTAISKAFKDKYGIQVDIVVGSAPVMLERVRSEYRARQFMTDVTDMNATRSLEMKNDKLTESAKDLPALRDKESWYAHPLDQDPEGHILTFYSNHNTPYINTNTVKAGEEPQSWLDLLQPRWKGKVLVGDPGVYVGTTHIYYGLVRKSNRLNEDFWRQLGGQIGKFVPGGARDQVLVLMRGEGPVNISVGSAGGAPLVAEGAPVKALNMKEGGISNPSQSLAMLNQAPHPNAARLFLNWFLSAEGLKVFAQTASQATLRKDVPDFLPANAKVDLSKSVNLDFKDLDEVNKLYNAGYLTKMWKGETGK